MDVFPSFDRLGGIAISGENRLIYVSADRVVWLAFFQDTVYQEVRIVQTVVGLIYEYFWTYPPSSSGFVSCVVAVLCHRARAFFRM
jgi:hypothetical protein